jgi:streptomycin 6-kinase
MTTATLGPVSKDCRNRLVSHYGNAVRSWLDTVPSVLAMTARRWHLTILGYHDAGHASVLAVATTGNGGHVMLKAWFDPGRYIRETSALNLWRGGPVPRLLHAADDLYVAALDLVADRPGGCPPPQGEEGLVAVGLRKLHTLGEAGAQSGAPPLGEYLADHVLRRIHQRDRKYRRALPKDCLAIGRNAVASLAPSVRRPVLLHTDLYRENIPFDQDGRPVFLDPLPMVGDPAFDWAFWTVYYDLVRDPRPRLRLACAYTNIPDSELLPWCLTLCFDGLLYYHETEDPREGRMAEVMTTLASASTGAQS